jgi:glyoxylase-like metal-dependent hydrolase (beta-lactamase superfamily II)
MEVAPGIHRIESVLGPRPFSQYLLRDERSLLFDTGVKETPAEVILPFLDGLQPDIVLISHADVDHFGGNAAIKQAAPRALFLAHELDVAWIESAARILRERYGWYAEHGLDYEPDVRTWLRDAMGPDTPIDVHLRAGERIRLGPRLMLEVLHLPGHTSGHIGLWDPASRTAIVMDAVLGRGLLDMDGTVIHPPPYYDVEGYLGAARTLQALVPQRLLTAHYDVMEGEQVDRFLADTVAFVEDAGGIAAGALAEAGEVTLPELLAVADPQLGPFSSMPNELAGSLQAHLREFVRQGSARADPSGLRWTAASPPATP